MANLPRIRVFDMKGRRYEIRAVADGNRVVVRAYADGKPANGLAYSIESDTQDDLARYEAGDGIEMLMELAHKDVVALAYPHSKPNTD